MIEYLRQFYYGHLAVLSGHFHYLTTEGLAERVGGEVLNIFQHILHLDFFQDNIYTLNRDNIIVAVEETFLVRVFDTQSLITLLDVPLHTRVDLYLSVLTSLLLVEGKTLTEYLFPRKGEKITDAKAKEAATSNKEAHSVLAIPV